MKTTTFQCFKHYGIPTRVTRLKIALNIADPISIKDSDSDLKLALQLPWRGNSPTYFQQIKAPSILRILQEIDEVDSKRFVCHFFFILSTSFIPSSFSYQLERRSPDHRRMFSILISLGLTDKDQYPSWYPDFFHCYWFKKESKHSFL